MSQVNSADLSRKSEISNHPSAARMRRLRQRRRDGAVLCKILVGPEAARELIDLGWMPPSADAETPREAMLAFLESALDRGIRRNV